MHRSRLHVTRPRRLIPRSDTAIIVAESLEGRRLFAAELVSVSASGLNDPGNAVSGGTTATGPSAPTVSTDGRFVAFVSEATNLSESDENNAADAFVRDVQNDATAIVSVNQPKTSTGNAASGVTGAGEAGPRISGDGRYVVFVSAASDLVPNDNNNAPDVFVQDRENFQTFLVSASGTNDATGDGASTSPVISDDGTWVAWVSTATNLVAGATDADGAVPDVFLRNMTDGVTELVSKPVSGPGGGAADGTAGAPVHRADGRYVAFAGAATDLTSTTGASGGAQVYVRDAQTDTTVLASPNAAGNGFANGAASHVALSADGRSVAFASTASNLVAGVTDANDGASDKNDVFVRDLDANATALVSAAAAGATSGNGASGKLAISSDGNVVVFESSASDLVAGAADANAAVDVFARDVTAGTTKLVSANAAGTAAGNAASGADAGGPSVSADGALVAFTTRAGDIAAAAPRGGVFVRDLQLNQTRLIAANPAAGSALASSALISGNGQQVVFTSDAADLTTGDTNGVTDVFVSPATPAAADPDLSVSVVATLPQAVLGGSKAKLPLNLSVANLGITPYDAFTTVKLYFSTDDLVDAGDFEAGSVTRRLKLAQNATKSLKAKVRQYPAATGNYHLVAFVDPTNALVEPNELNNVQSTPNTVQVAAPFVDLGVDMPTPLASMTRGKRASVLVTLQNLGNVPASGKATLTLTAAPSVGSPSPDPVLATVPLKLKVKPGVTKRQTVRFTVPLDLSAIPHTLVATLAVTPPLVDTAAGNDVAISEFFVEVL